MADQVVFELLTIGRQKALDEIQRFVSDAGIAVEKFDKVFQKLDVTTGKYTTTASGLNKEFGRVTATLSQAEGEANRFSLSFAKADEALSRGGKSAKEAASSVQNLSDHFSNFGRSLASATEFAAFYAFVGALRQAVTEGAEFSRILGSIQGLKAGFGAQEILGVSGQTGIGAIEAAQGARELLRNQLGQGADGFRNLQLTARLAELEMISFSDATKVVSAAVHGFGVESKDVGEAVAELARVSRLSGVPLEDLTPIYGRLSVLGRELGFSMRDVDAAIVTLSRSGTSTGEIGRELENLFKRFANPGNNKAVKDFVDSLGGLAGIASLGLAGTLKALSDALKEGSISLGQVANDVNDVRTLQALLKLVGDDAKEFEKVVKELSGSAIPEFNDRLKTLESTGGKQLDLMLNKLKLGSIAFGRSMLDEVAPALEKVNKALDGNLEKNSKLELFLRGFKGTSLGFLSTLYEAATLNPQTTQVGIPGPIKGGVLDEAAEASKDALRQLAERTKELTEEDRRFKETFKEDSAQIKTSMLDRERASEEGYRKLLEDARKFQSEIEKSLKETEKLKDEFQRRDFTRFDQLIAAKIPERTKELLTKNQYVSPPEYLQGEERSKYVLEAELNRGLKRARTLETQATGEYSGPAEQVEDARKKFEELFKLLDGIEGKVLHGIEAGLADENDYLRVEGVITKLKQEQLGLEDKLREKRQGQITLAQSQAEVEKERIDNFKKAVNLLFETKPDKFSNRAEGEKVFEERASNVLKFANVNNAENVTLEVAKLRAEFEHAFDISESLKGISTATEEVKKNGNLAAEALDRVSTSLGSVIQATLPMSRGEQGPQGGVAAAVAATTEKAMAAISKELSDLPQDITSRAEARQKLNSIRSRTSGTEGTDIGLLRQQELLGKLPGATSQPYDAEGNLTLPGAALSRQRAMEALLDVQKGHEALSGYASPEGALEARLYPNGRPKLTPTVGGVEVGDISVTINGANAPAEDVARMVVDAMERSIRRQQIKLPQNQ